VIESIRNHDPDLAQKIMDKMFVFDDVLKLDDKAIQMVLKEVASDVLIVASRVRSPNCKEKIPVQHVVPCGGDLARRPGVARADAPVRSGSQQKEMLKTCAACRTKARS
jgi:flagellar motor switch protein FliG